jgi:hypothetical protein
MLWHISYREGAEGAGAVGGPSGSTQASTCDSVNAQNKADLEGLNTKLNNAIALSDTIKTMEGTLANNTKRIDEIINTQLSALITKK